MLSSFEILAGWFFPARQAKRDREVDMSVIAREKLLRRLELCKSELSRCKAALGFWSNELRLVVDAIAEDKQFMFEDVLGKDGVS